MKHQFEKIGFVTGRGHADHLQKYTYQDVNAFEKITYYRLKQLDSDGRFSYSKIVSIQGLTPDFTLTPAPNPALAQQLIFQVRGIASGVVDFTLLDKKGRVVYTNPGQDVSVGNRIIVGETAGLTPGVYFARIASEGRKATVSIVIAR